MKKPTRNKKLFLILGILVIAAVLAAAGFLLLSKQQGSADAEETLKSMEEIIPYFGTDYEVSGLGRDPLPMISIDGVDIVGGLEIPSLDLRVPVAAEGFEKEYFATYVSGSPIQGQLRLSGGWHDTFSKLSDGKPGEKVIFTDVDGVKYSYTITTQFHLKNWDEAEYDLMLCYETDGDTEFVLACTKE